MDKKEIIKEVTAETERWLILQKQFEPQYSISEKAIDFIVEVIHNIKEDPSASWNLEQPNYEHAQEYAILLIPNVLNDIVNDRTFKRRKKYIDGKITTWEIWHSLSRAIDKWCFIPKDV